MLASCGPAILKSLEDEVVDPILAGLVSKLSMWSFTRWIKSAWHASTVRNCSDSMFLLFVHYCSTNTIIAQQTGWRCVKTPLTVPEFLVSIPKPVKPNIVSLTARHRCDVSAELCCPGAKPRRWVPPIVARIGEIPRVYNKDSFFYLIIRKNIVNS